MKGVVFGVMSPVTEKLQEDECRVSAVRIKWKKYIIHFRVMSHTLGMTLQALYCAHGLCAWNFFFEFLGICSLCPRSRASCTR